MRYNKHHHPLDEGMRTRMRMLSRVDGLLSTFMLYGYHFFIFQSLSDFSMAFLEFWGLLAGLVWVWVEECKSGMTIVYDFVLSCI